MPEKTKSTKVTTEGSARVLTEVMGRLERMDAGEAPAIERVGPDGTTRRVDATGKMIRPDAARVAAVNEAAEAFASEHREAAATPATAPVSARPAASTPAPEPTRTAEPERKGLWARIKALFGRS